mmetsp:Transcript_42355/g.78942  ORF Transcript_42355/g.78942 Transcript_42355/m.78942 type:complete len:204 (+) Transcript_42355:1248-1859(+)
MRSPRPQQKKMQSTHPSQTNPSRKCACASGARRATAWNTGLAASMKVSGASSAADMSGTPVWTKTLFSGPLRPKRALTKNVACKGPASTSSVTGASRLAGDTATTAQHRVASCKTTMMRMAPLALAWRAMEISLVRAGRRSSPLERACATPPSKCPRLCGFGSNVWLERMPADILFRSHCLGSRDLPLALSWSKARAGQITVK